MSEHNALRLTQSVQNLDNIYIFAANIDAAGKHCLKTSLQKKTFKQSFWRRPLNPIAATDDARCIYCKKHQSKNIGHSQVYGELTSNGSVQSPLSPSKVKTVYAINEKKNYSENTLMLTRM